MNAVDKMKALDDKTEAAIDKIDTAHQLAFEELLIEEGIKAFVLWATAFPKRHLRFCSGMGVSAFACPSTDNHVFLMSIDDHCEGIKGCYHSDKVEAMFQPLIDLHNSFWGSTYYRYPAMYDFLYNPVTRTVEYHDQIIYLDMDQQ